jgi:hypothetical protein
MSIQIAYELETTPYKNMFRVKIHLKNQEEKTTHEFILIKQEKPGYNQSLHIATVDILNRDIYCFSEFEWMTHLDTFLQDKFKVEEKLAKSINKMWKKSYLPEIGEQLDIDLNWLKTN